MVKKQLWVRVLSCGHERETILKYLCGDYSKPEIGDDAYCRECLKNAKIISVRKGG